MAKVSFVLPVTLSVTKSKAIASRLNPTMIVVNRLTLESGVANQLICSLALVSKIRTPWGL